MSAAQATPPAPTIGIVAAPNPVSRTDTATITVTVDPGLVGENVTLENKVLGLVWTQVGSAVQLNSDLKAQFTVIQNINGNYQYRAKVVANANHTAGTSPTRVLSVVTNAVPQTQPGVFSCAGASAPSVAHPGGGSWACMYNDEFAGTALDTTYWHVSAQGYMTQPKTEKACFGNEATNNVDVANDYLELRATVYATAQHCPGDGHPAATSRKFGAMVFHNQPDGTEPTLEQTTGYYEVRAKLPTMHGELEGQANGTVPDSPDDLPANWDAVKGLQETFYLWPSSDRYGLWPASGELDFAEFYSGAGNIDNPAIHQSSGTDYGGWTKPNCNISTATGGDPGGFNTYKFLWTSTHLTTWVNDNPNPCTDTTYSGQPFDKGFFLTLAQSFGGASTLNDYVLTPGPNTDVGTTYVDYVRVWQ